MAKTTKKARGIHSCIKFQKHQGVQSLTIEGKQELADLSQDKNGDTSLILNADKDKVNTIVSSVPYIGISHTTTGADPNQEKTATVSQDLTKFPLNDGELVKFNKQKDGISVNDEELKADISQLIESKLNGLPIVLYYEHNFVDKFIKFETDIQINTLFPFYQGLEIRVYKAHQYDMTFISVNDLFGTKQIKNGYIASVLVEFVNNKLHITINAHDENELHFELRVFTPYQGQKTFDVTNTYPSEHFEGYKNPNEDLGDAGNLTYEVPKPPTTTETPSNPPELPNVTFPMASTSPQPEVAGNQPQPLAEETH